MRKRDALRIVLDSERKATRSIYSVPDTNTPLCPEIESFRERVNENIRAIILQNMEEIGEEFPGFRVSKPGKIIENYEIFSLSNHSAWMSNVTVTNEECPNGISLRELNNRRIQENADEQARICSQIEAESKTLQKRINQSQNPISKDLVDQVANFSKRMNQFSEKHN